MNGDAITLSPEILDRFLAALRFAGAPLGDAIEPGLTDAEVDGVAKDLGVPVPPELRTLWKWGIPSTAAGATEAGWDVNPHFELWPPSNVVSATRLYRSSFEPLPGQIAFAGPPQTCCLVVPASDSMPNSPVTYAFLDGPERINAAPSLGALFRLWAEQLSNGAYTFSGGKWNPLDGPLAFIGGNEPR